MQQEEGQSGLGLVGTQISFIPKDKLCRETDDNTAQEKASSSLGWVGRCGGETPTQPRSNSGNMTFTQYKHNALQPQCNQ